MKEMVIDVKTNQALIVDVSSKEIPSNEPPPVNPIDELRKQQADLIFELMIKGVL